MKHPRLLTTLALLASALPAFAQLNIPSANGSDGAFNPTGATFTVDLSQAIPGDALTFSNSGGNVGKGIYDSARWVVVFKYSSVNVPAGTTVNFINHPSYAPVVWLVQGTVTVNGTVNLNGKVGATGPAGGIPTEPGPGGFRGGPFSASGAGFGLGPGGAGVGADANTTPATYASSYGNPQILPLIGGSGAGQAFNRAYSGGAGGGAILIAAQSNIQLAGSITAIGGADGNTAGGSGGAIKLIANQVAGSGNLNSGTQGRLRIETNSLAATIVANPVTIAVPPGTTPTLFQSLSSPTVKIVSVDGVASPADPTAPLVSAADIAIQKNTPVTIVLRTENFATAGAVVAVRIANKFGSATTLNATLQSGGTTALSTWTLSTTLSPGFVTLQARATQN
jgi:plastocyanin